MPRLTRQTPIDNSTAENFIPEWFLKNQWRYNPIELRQLQYSSHKACISMHGQGRLHSLSLVATGLGITHHNQTIASKMPNKRIGWKQKIYNLSFVLHISPMTFFGAGSAGPLSRCPDVK